MFAHLRLRANPIESNALDNSPTIKALGCVLSSQRSLAGAANSADATADLC